MRIDLENLPSDPMLLQRLVRDMAAAVETREIEIGRLQEIIRKLQRLQFGRRSERMTGGLDADQLDLALEDLDGDVAALREAGPAVVARSPERAPHRKPLPDHVPREEVVLAPESGTCPCCGEALQPAGESVSEMLDWVPARVRVIRTRRPKLACRRCGTLHQHPAPERVIAGGLATPALLAQVLTAKYCDHTPLYRQSRIFARHGIDLARSTLAGWVGGACWWLEALHDRLRKDVLASNHLFADDTPVPVLDPGNGRTKTGRLWVYARDQRGWSGSTPPAAVYIFAPDRKAERPATHLGAYRGVLHVDCYAGFDRLTRGGTITLAACWAHTRRKFHDVFQSTGSPIAEEAMERIRDIYLVEAAIRGQPPPFRLAARRQHAGLLVDDLRLWLDRQLPQVPGRSGLAEAIRYAIARWAGLKRFLDDGCVELDTNPVERAIRPVALGRKNHLFAGSDGGGHRWAVICSLIETCKLNGVEPYAYLTDILQRMIDGHPANRLDDLLPWNWKPDHPVNP